jgi:1,4-dihydroxy-2-naphthoyl-CoA hydrolase
MKKIWFKELSLEKLNSFNANTLVDHLQINITEFTDNSLTGIMPVKSITHQPMGLLHGGASCVLAESLGSIAANCTIDLNQFMAVGQHIEATHLRPVQSGFVKGTATPVHMGKSSQLWRIEIYNEEEKLVCDTKILMAIITRNLKNA